MEGKGKYNIKYGQLEFEEFLDGKRWNGNGKDFDTFINI